MRFRYILILILGVSLLLSLSCKKKDAKTGKAPAGDETQPVVVEELALRPLDEFVIVSGKLEGIVDVTMNSETGGRILELSKKLGDRVAAGERIGRVENDVIRIRWEQAQAALQSAQTAYDNANKNATYAAESYKRKLISEAESNSVMSALKGALAALEGARANLESARLAYENSYLKAPVAGSISNLFVSVGQYINPNQAIATLTDASTLILKTGVGESQINKIKVNQGVELQYPGIPQAFNARIRGFGIRPLANQATYPIEIELKNPGSLLPGMVVSAKILTNRYPNLLYTPITNVIKEFDKNYVYIVNAENLAERRSISLGMVIGENVVLASGVSAGEKIVISGTENLEEGTKVEIRK